MKRIILFCVPLFLISCASIDRYNEKITTKHTVKQLQKDVDKTYRKLQKLHPKLYGYITKERLDFKFDSLKQTIQEPLTSKEFYKKLAPVIAEVRQGHISVSYPKTRFHKKERKAILKKKFEFNDLEFEYLNNGLWITNTRGKDSTVIGSEIVKVEGEPIPSIIDAYKKRMASDGYNTTFYNRIIAFRFSDYVYKNEGFKDSITVTLKRGDSIFDKTFKRIAKAKKKKDTIKENKVVRLTKAERKALKIKQKKKRKANVKYGYNTRKKEYTRIFDFIGKDSSVAYMKIRVFDGRYKEFFQESFKKIDSAKATHMILDLRNNPGGSVNQITDLYSYFATEKFKMVKEAEVLTRVPVLKSVLSYNASVAQKVFGSIFSPLIVAHNLIKTHKKDGKRYYKLKNAKETEVNPLRFKGKLYVLTNGASFSASSILSTNLKASNRAVIIGEETGGAFNGTVAGLFKNFRLPHSRLSIRMGMMQVETPYTTSPDGYGVTPDVEVLPKLEDRLIGRDTEIQWVLEDIKKKKAP
ncbi:S41 family peptidase [Aquimarina rhabdastrellae]